MPVPGRRGAVGAADRRRTASVLADGVSRRHMFCVIAAVGSLTHFA
jgi:hypothetical protein